MVVSKDFQNKIVHDVLVLGPGGCGKSAFASAWAKMIVKGHPDHISRVLVSENLSFDTFFGGYRPVTIKSKEEEKEKITYQFIPGFFFKMYLEAKMNPDDNFVLIVEEINRGDAYNIFGDIFQLLDRKKEKDENGEKNESEYSVSISEEAKAFIKNMIQETNGQDGFYFGIKVQQEKLLNLARFFYDENEKNSENIKKGKIKIPNNMFIVATANTDIAGMTRLDTAFLRRFSNIYMSLEGQVYGRPYDRHVLGFAEKKYKTDFTAENDESTINKEQYEKFRNDINGVILNDPNLSDDKLLSQHFVKMDKNESNGVEYFHNEDFIINVLMYLRDNVFRDEFKDKVLNECQDLNELWKEKNIWDKVKIIDG